MNTQLCVSHETEDVEANLGTYVGSIHNHPPHPRSQRELMKSKQHDDGIIIDDEKRLIAQLWSLQIDFLVACLSGVERSHKSLSKLSSQKAL